MKCPRCGNYGWFGHHTCPPAYDVWLKDDEDQEDVVEVLADSPEEAATKFVEKHYADWDYPKAVTVIVKNWRADNYAGRLYTYEVTVEAHPVFTAGLLSEKPATDEAK